MFVSGNADYPFASDIIAKWTLENLVMKEILDWVLYNWPKKNKSVEF